eukprot:GHVO01031037.1.p1 GENE.GHVO01031037.1~~GHVO01031037.1.p1  ORF type:complete len:146 (+),score=17.54 GHVO01031037.1:344-781(+)
MMLVEPARQDYISSALLLTTKKSQEKAKKDNEVIQVNVLQQEVDDMAEKMPASSIRAFIKDVIQSNMKELRSEFKGIIDKTDNQASEASKESKPRKRGRSRVVSEKEARKSTAAAPSANIIPPVIPLLTLGRSLPQNTNHCSRRR